MQGAPRLSDHALDVVSGYFASCSHVNYLTVVGWCSVVSLQDRPSVCDGGGCCFYKMRNCVSWLPTNNVSLAIVEADVLDLYLRMSQPNAPDSKRDNNIMATGLELTFPESSSAVVSQVNKLHHLELTFPESSSAMVSQQMSSASQWDVPQHSTAVPSQQHQRSYPSAFPGFFPNLQVEQFMHGLPEVQRLLGI